jgi:hypothetical protein
MTASNSTHRQRCRRSLGTDVGHTPRRGSRRTATRTPTRTRVHARAEHRVCWSALDVALRAFLRRCPCRCVRSSRRRANSPCTERIVESFLVLEWRTYRSHRPWSVALPPKPCVWQPDSSLTRVSSPCSPLTPWRRRRGACGLWPNDQRVCVTAHARSRRRLATRHRPDGYPCLAPDLIHCAACRRAWPPLPRPW